MSVFTNRSQPAACAGDAPASGHLEGLHPADWLSLAAAPTFIAMAFAAVFADKAQILCSADQGAFPLTGMAMMYLLMSAFHLSPWLRLLTRAKASGLSGPFEPASRPGE